MQEDSAIIVVADATAAASALRALLEQAGYAVELVADDRSALAHAERADLLVLDVELPTAGALEVLKAVRARRDRRHLPVVVVSSADDVAARVAALELGADDFVCKPWHDGELLARVKRCLTLRRRVDHLLERHDELEQLSLTDGLTDLANHRHFHERLRDEFRRAQRYDDPLALVLLDLDHFKAVNDGFGHLVGDEVLREVASSLRKSVRETDFVARYGGEEFAVILPKTHLAGCLTVAERMWSELGRLRLGPRGSVRVTASLGISGYPNRSIVSAEQLLRAADDALYRAKSEGRNKICLYQQAAAFTMRSGTTTGRV